MSGAGRGPLRLHVLIQGYPGKATLHGGLGWSTVALLRGEGREILIDTGSYGCRDLLRERLGELGLGPGGITDVVLSHCHWDHICNFPMFPDATIHVPRAELEWAREQPPATWHLAELHVAELAARRSAHLIDEGEEFLPGLRALSTPGHTPGHHAFLAEAEGGPVLFAADAAKNQAELLSGRQDLTLDPEQSRVSIERIRETASARPGTLVVCGHDRLLSLDGTGVVHRSTLRAEIRARLSPDFDEEAVFDLTR